MDSPSSRSEHSLFNEDDESEHALSSLWNSIKPLHKFLSLLVVSLVLAALGFSSLPLWRPIGALVLQRLWDVLRFLVVTTSIGLGILNSRLWRGTYTEDDSVASNSGKEDSLTSKVPFVGMFDGEMQHSYSFSDKGKEASEYGSVNTSESERQDMNAATSADREHDVRLMDGGHYASAPTLPAGHHGNVASFRGDSDDHPYTQHATMLVNGPTFAVSTTRGIPHQRDGIRANGTDHEDDKEDGAVIEDASVNPSIHMRRNAVNVVTRGKNRLVKHYDDLGLAAVAEAPKLSGSNIKHGRGGSLEFPIGQEWGTSVLANDAATVRQIAAREKRGKSRLVMHYDDLGLAAVAEDPKLTGSKIKHRRGGSLEFPIGQEWGTSVLANDAPTVRQIAAREKVSSSEKNTSFTASNAPVHVNKNGTEASSSIPAARQGEHSNIDDIDAGIPAAASKHSRSQSAYNLNELLVQQRPRSKAGTSSSQLSRRRNVSLSCDLDKEYTSGGVPAWLSSLPSPPEPPLIYGYDSAENKVEVAESKQDESSLRKAFTESLAPWRAATNTVPVNIPTFKHKESTPTKKKTEKQMVSTLPSSPSTPNTMGSPSPGELNKKVDAFIARFHQRMRLQRLESFERSKQRDL